jgi:putative membrane protein
VIGSALLSTLHLLALVIGLPGVFLRGKALRALQQDPSAVERVLAADNLWGVAALLWLGTGLTRAFGGFEKGSSYYLNNSTFLVKMGLFAAVLVLEIWPMATFIRWRIRKAKGLVLDTSRARQLSRVNDVELLLTLAMPFFASMMARGIGFTWFGGP